MADRIFCCWAQRVTPHPSSSAVKRVYYPVCNLRWEKCHTTPPTLLLDRAWTPRVRAMANNGVDNAKTDKGYR